MIKETLKEWDTRLNQHESAWWKVPNFICQNCKKDFTETETELMSEGFLVLICPHCRHGNIQ